MDHYLVLSTKKVEGVTGKFLTDESLNIHDFIFHDSITLATERIIMMISCPNSLMDEIRLSGDFMVRKPKNLRLLLLSLLLEFDILFMIWDPPMVLGYAW